MNSVSNTTVDIHPSNFIRYNSENWKSAIKQSAPLLIVVVTYLIVSAVVLMAYNPGISDGMLNKILKTAIGSGIFAAAAFCIFCITLIANRRPPSPTRLVVRELRDGPLSAECFPKLMIAWVCIVVFMPIFVEMKAIFTSINDFSYDQTFQQWDKWLHFGKQPAEWIQPLFFADQITIAVHTCYYIWFSVIFTTFFWQAATKNDPELRLQFLTAFFATWFVVGTIMAVSLSSAGPIFYDRLPVGDAQTYAVPMAYLEKINEYRSLFTIEVRELLWKSYTGEKSDDIARGISAMPSMHVAISFLLILLGWRKSTFAGVAYTLFGIIIMLGSVHLLWHYAIDGYVSILAVSLIWWLSGKAARHTLAKA